MSAHAIEMMQVCFAVAALVFSLHEIIEAWKDFLVSEETGVRIRRLHTFGNLRRECVRALMIVALAMAGLVPLVGNWENPPMTKQAIVLRLAASFVAFMFMIETYLDRRERRILHLHARRAQAERQAVTNRRASDGRRAQDATIAQMLRRQDGPILE